MKKEAFTELLVKAKIAPEVTADQELLSIINAALAELKKDNPVNLVASRLSRSLTTYLLGHQFKAPKSVIEVHKVAKEMASHYQGTAFSTMILGGLLGGR